MAPLADGSVGPAGRTDGAWRIDTYTSTTSTRRRFLGLSASAAVALAASGSTAGRVLAALGPGRAGTEVLAPGEPAGVIALPRGREIGLVRANGSEDRTILSLKPGEFVADVALSPDGTRIAFGVFTAGTSGPGGSDIAVASVGSSASGYTVVVPRDRPGMLLAAPSWSPDGTALVFEGVGLGANGKPTIISDWVAADGSGRRTVVENARFPTLSPDGREVAYVKSRPTGDSLYARPLDGGPERQLLSETQFVAIIGPRYSPDGASIAFAGVADQPMLAPKRLGPMLLGSPSIDPATGRVVAGHGMPADAYLVPSTGGDARLAALLSYDDLALTWSPDGAWLAVSGAVGLKLARLADGTIQPVTENGSFGAIDWR